MRKLSASGLSMFRSCPMSFYYKYIRGIVRVEDTDTPSLRIGKMFHSILEGEPLDYIFDDKLLMSIEASADFVLNEYKVKELGNRTIGELAKNSIKEYELSIDNFIGYIDLVIQEDDGDTLIDYKYVASLDYVDSYQLSDQTKLYPYLYTKQTGRKVKQFTYICVVKPTIRQKKDESREAYFERIVEWYGNKEDSIATVFIGKDKLDKLELEIKQDLHFFKHMIDNDIFYRDTGSCTKYNSKCAYYPICYDEPDCEIYYKERDK